MVSNFAPIWYSTLILISTWLDVVDVQLSIIETNLAGVGPFQNRVRQPCPPFKMAAVTKKTFLQLSIAALVQVKMSSNFNCSYMARSRLICIPFFSVKFFFRPIYANWAYFDKRSHLNLLWNRWTKLNQTWQGGSLSKLCPTAPPSIQDGCCY